jgi:tRNA A37 threonylcarbamoyladenosine synthetase subunit TsaC/SUA5/YrdC
VSIVSADGTAQVATTTVNEKNGWLYLSANGFTYSAPTVRVKLTQEVDKPVATPSANASSQVTAAKKTTITCVKGKTSKKVTAAKPLCPAGFKKK